MNDDKVTASMWIRAKPETVFNAFVEPALLKKFWLSDASGPLSTYEPVRWDFMVPGATETVTTLAFERPRRLALRWASGIDVDMTFEEFEGGTRVAVACSGFNPDQLLAEATDVVEGFAIVLCDLKTLLETTKSAELVRAKAALIAADMKTRA